MAFKATLSIEGKEELTLLECSYTLDRKVSSTGNPVTDVKGGTIRMAVESSEDTFFFDWIVNPYATKSGSIKFFKRNNVEAVMKELKFEDAYLISYNERMDAATDSPMTETLVISAKTLTMNDDATHDNRWPD